LAYVQRDAVNGNLVDRLEASGVEFRLDFWYEGYAASDVGNVGFPWDMYEVRAWTEASEQQVQRVGEGSQVWICKISMDYCSQGGCVVSLENNVSVAQQVREGHYCCDESEQLVLIDLRLQVASVHNDPFNNGGGNLATTDVIQAGFFVVYDNSEVFTPQKAVLSIDGGASGSTEVPAKRWRVR